MQTWFDLMGSQILASQGSKDKDLEQVESGYKDYVTIRLKGEDRTWFTRMRTYQWSFLLISQVLQLGVQTKSLISYSCTSIGRRSTAGDTGSGWCSIRDEWREFGEVKVVGRWMRSEWTLTPNAVHTGLLWVLDEQIAHIPRSGW